VRGKRLIVAAAVVAVVGIGAYLFVKGVLASDLVRSTLERQLSERLGQPVRIGSASAAVFPRIALDLHDITIAGGQGIAIENIRIVTGLRGLLSRTVSDAEVLVRGARVPLPLPSFTGPRQPERQERQAPAAPSDAPGAESGGLTIASIRVIALRNVTLSAGAAQIVVDADSSIDGDRLAIPRLSARAATTRIEAEGALTSMARSEGRLAARADPLDLDELLAFASAATAGPAAGKGAARPGGEGAGPMRIAIELTAPAGSFTTYTFSDLSTRMELTADRVTLDPLSVKTFGGTFQGRLEADTGRSEPQLSLNGRLGGLDVPALLRASGSAGGITGQLSGSVALNAAAGAASIVDTARGSIDVAVTDGNIPGLDMVRTLVLAFGKPSGAPPEGSGTAFSRIGGRFALGKGTLSSESIALASRDFDMAASGSLRLATGAVNARADVVLSKELTGQAGTDLRRYAQEDGRVVVPAAIGGTLQNPRVTPDIAAATRRAVGNELKRRVKSFVDDLFKKE
jgi:uncharacterized protein involved in outer membrane biogenesis